jgi:hypothetical protein
MKKVTAAPVAATRRLFILILILGLLTTGEDER